MRPWAPAITLCLLATAAAGCLSGPAPSGSDDAGLDGPVIPAQTHAVVATIDTGINPYHAVFRDDSPQALLHPSTYLPGYPADAVALTLTFGAEDYWDAVRQDCAQVWSNVEPGVLYWVPGTKIVGAVYLEGQAGADCDRDRPLVHGILDRNGHGTMVASRAAGNGYGACPECRIVSVQFPANIKAAEHGEDGDVVKWTADNAHWIDVQSNSWGPLLPVPMLDAVPQQYIGGTPELARVVEEASQAHLAFWASGNGALFRFGVAGHPTLLAPHMAPSAIIVGGHDSGQVTLWPGFTPHLVSDACDAWAAWHDHLEDSSERRAGGTSGATPFVAGGAARILLEARILLGHMGTGIHDGVAASGEVGQVADGPLADGAFTMDEWREVLYKTATARPERQEEDGPPCEGTVLYDPLPVEWRQVPEAAPAYPLIGYGAVDAPAMELAFQVLHGEAGLPERPDEERYFDLDRQAREAFYGIYSGLP